MPRYDFSQINSGGYATHQALLVKYALQAKRGSTIVELGCGRFSTIILSQIAKYKKLRYIVYTDDGKWAEAVKPSCEDNIEWNIIDDWTRWQPTEDAYFYFLDNSELMVNRYKQIPKLIGLSEYVICHDSNIYKQRGCDLRAVYDVIEEDTTQIPNTAVIRLTGDKNALTKPLTEQLTKTEKPKSPKLSMSMGFKQISNISEEKKEKTKIAEKIEVEWEPEQKVMEFSNIKPPLVDVGYVEEKISIPQRSSNSIDFDKKVEKVAVVSCFTPGGDYDNNFLEYIQRLADGVHQNNTIGADFFCITLLNLDNIKGVKRIEPLSGKWSGWHVKAEVFRADLWRDYDRVLYLDLDTVITGNIDKILTSKSPLTLLRDFYQQDVWETGMIFFAPGMLDIYDVFNPDNPPPKTKKDAEIISDYLKQNSIIPDFFQDKFKVGSYKISLIRDNLDWKDYSIICFHGNPRPHEVNWELEARIQRKGPLTGGFKKKGPSGYYGKAKKRPVSVEPIWEFEDVFIIGGGPSLTNVDLDKFLFDKNVIGINDGYLFDCCDICFFGDTVWWKYHKEEIQKYDIPFYSTSGVDDSKVLYVESSSKGLTKQKTKLGWNCCSGWAGLNLALNLGAKRVFLLGYDMNFGKDGESNWHENIRKVNSNSYKVFLNQQQKIINDFEKVFSDRQVFNIEIGDFTSAIKIFPKIKFHKLFEVSEKDVMKPSLPS